jgi:hypothetical protein
MHCTTGKLFVPIFNMPSTVIAHIDYDPTTSRLRIRFVSGVTYQYENVPEEVYEALKTSREKGVYLNQNIKGNYVYKKV